MNGSNIKQMYEDSIYDNEDKSQQSINRIREIKINDSNLTSNKSISYIESPSILLYNRRREPIITHYDINIDLIKHNNTIDDIPKSNHTMHSYKNSGKELTKPQINDVSSSLTLPKKIFNATGIEDINTMNSQHQNQLSLHQNNLIDFGKEDEYLDMNNISLDPLQYNKFNHINERLQNIKIETQQATLQKNQYPNTCRADIDGNRCEEPTHDMYRSAMQKEKNHIHLPPIDHEYSSSNEGMNKVASNYEAPLYIHSGNNILFGGNQNYDAIYANQSNQSGLNSLYSGKVSSENGPNNFIKDEVNRMNLLQDYDLQSVLY